MMPRGPPGAMPRGPPPGMFPRGQQPPVMQQQQQQQPAKRKQSDNAPNNTLYVNHIYEKLKGLELQRALYQAFKKFGKILDIVIANPPVHHLRGQAWLVFETIEAATKAKDEMQGFPFFGHRELGIQFAKTQSDVIAKKNGTYKPRPKRVKVEKSEPVQETTSAPATQEGEAAVAAVTVATPAPALVPKKRKHINAVPNLLRPRHPKPMPVHKVLIASDLPDGCTQEMLVKVLQPFPGFQEVRLVAAKRVAFIEFSHDGAALSALQNLNNFKLTPNNLLFLNFANK